MATQPQEEHVRIQRFIWQRHGRAVLSFQREIYEANFAGCVVDRDFLKDYAANLRDASRWDTEHLVVLERGDRTLGFMWLSIVSTLVDPCVGYIKNIYVAPQLRGEGWAERLMAYADEWFSSRGCNRAALDATCTNDRAVGLYEKCGFEVVRYRMEKRYD